MIRSILQHMMTAFFIGLIAIGFNYLDHQDSQAKQGHLIKAMAAMAKTIETGSKALSNCEGE